MNTDTDCLHSAAVTPVIDGAVGVSDLNWYVAIVNARHEKVVAEKLTVLGIENYVALQNELRIYKNGRRKTVARVVIPSVVFIRCTEQERRQAVQLPFIYRFMVNRSARPNGLTRPVAIVPSAQIDKLKFMLGQSDIPVEFDPEIYRVNDAVRVIRGSLRGLQGEVCQNPDGSHTLIISLPLLGGAKVRINPLDIEKV